MISSPLKVAIVGKSPHSFQFAPYDDPSWEIWTLGSAAAHLPRWNAAFEIHELNDGLSRWESAYVQWLAQDHGKPIYVQRLDGRVPSGKAFPRDEVIDLCGSYHTSSISWMIGLALYQGASSIGLWGVDMAVTGQQGDSEYEHQRPSCEYLLGFARGRGVDVFVHPFSSLLKGTLYGFDLQACERFRLRQQRITDLRNRIAKAQQYVRESKEAEHRLTGSLEQLLLSAQWE